MAKSSTGAAKKLNQRSAKSAPKDVKKREHVEAGSLDREALEVEADEEEGKEEFGRENP